VVNGAGDAAADGARGLGSLMRGIQTGRIQQYMVLVVAAVVVIAALIFANFRL
jgi:hypothetical protein